ncbi:tagaturonate epimerase family protein [Planctomycetota bacterium]
MKFETLDIEPQKNPAVLDTATWDPTSAWHRISEIDESFWMSVSRAIKDKHPLPLDEHCVVYAGSCAEYHEKIFSLAELADGQHVFLEIGTDEANGPLKEPIGIRSLSNGARVASYRAEAAAIERYVSLIRPDKGPKMLGAVPRLGIGSRMTTAAWPGVWRTLNRCNIQSNPVQNSVREVNLLEDVLAGRQARLNYMANFGRVEEGHTGSTFQGIWVAGILEALKADSAPPYGADADHITVRRGDDDLAHAKRVIEAARLYTFFTLDVSDLLDYETCLIDKYRSALDVVEQLSKHIAAIKKGAPFDFELSIDETPSDVETFSCLTSESELVFLLRELQRRQLPVTHIAPNFGIEKEFDYRGRDGLDGLEKRIRGLCQCAGEFDVLLDCHSGDDLKSETRKVVGRAAKGNIHFKISPALQIIFAEVLNEFDPEKFRFWWDDTLNYARLEAEADSDFAADCLHQHKTSNDRTPSPNHSVFHYYGFATVGRRDDKGQFIHRQKFYELPEDFYRLYQNRVALYLDEVASDVFDNAS